MSRVRYGARTEEQLRNREVEATSVDVWATTLVATYLTDPELIAAVLPPPRRAGRRAPGQGDGGHGGHPGLPDVRCRELLGARRATRGPTATTPCSCR